MSSRARTDGSRSRSGRAGGLVLGADGAAARWCAGSRLRPQLRHGVGPRPSARPGRTRARAGVAEGRAVRRRGGGSRQGHRRNAAAEAGAPGAARRGRVRRRGPRRSRPGGAVGGHDRRGVEPVRGRAARDGPLARAGGLRRPALAAPCGRAVAVYGVGARTAAGPPAAGQPQRDDGPDISTGTRRGRCPRCRDAVGAVGVPRRPREPAVARGGAAARGVGDVEPGRRRRVRAARAGPVAGSVGVPLARRDLERAGRAVVLRGRPRPTAPGRPRRSSRGGCGPWLGLSARRAPSGARSLLGRRHGGGRPDVGPPGCHRTGSPATSPAAACCGTGRGCSPSRPRSPQCWWDAAPPRCAGCCPTGSRSRWSPSGQSSLRSRSCPTRRLGSPALSTRSTTPPRTPRPRSTSARAPTATSPCCPSRATARPTGTTGARCSAPLGRYLGRPVVVQDDLVVDGSSVAGGGPAGRRVQAALEAPDPAQRATALRRAGVRLLVVEDLPGVDVPEVSGEVVWRESGLHVVDLGQGAGPRRRAAGLAADDGCRVDALGRPARGGRLPAPRDAE